MELLLLPLLILLNGVFALSEIAVLSAREARLRALADQGRPGAGSALGLKRIRRTCREQQGQVWPDEPVE